MVRSEEALAALNSYKNLVCTIVAREIWSLEGLIWGRYGLLALFLSEVARVALFFRQQESLINGKFGLIRDQILNIVWSGLAWVWDPHLVNNLSTNSNSRKFWHWIWALCLLVIWVRTVISSKKKPLKIKMEWQHVKHKFRYLIENTTIICYFGVLKTQG